MKKTIPTLKFLILFIFISSYSSAQIIYPQVGGECDKATFINSKDVEIKVENTANGQKGNKSNKPTCSGLPFNQSTYLLFQVAKTGTLNFDIVPESNLSEYDWFLFKFSDCGSSTQQTPGELACNFATNKKSSSSSANTGMSLDGTGDASIQDPYTKEITVDQYQVYLLQVDHYGEYVSGPNPNSTPNGDLGYTIIFKGTFEMSTIFTGVKTEISKNQFSVSPNPFIDNAILNIDLINPQNLKLEIFNLLGQSMSLPELEKISRTNFPVGNSQINLNLTDLPFGIGMYVLKISYDGGSRSILLTKSL